LKKVFLFSLLLAVAFFSAVGAGTATAQSDQLNIITTVFPIFDFTRTVGADHVQVSQLLPPGADSHSYEPTPREIVRLQEADLFIYVGGESDAWIDSILESLGKDAPQTLKLIDSVRAVPEELVEGMQEEEGHDHEGEHEEHDEHGEEVVYDEHIWTAPQNAVLMTQAIAAKLIEVDSSNAAAYEENAAAFVKKLEALDASYRGFIEYAARKTIVVGDRFPFRYLADAYGLEYYAAFPGCSADVEPSAATIAFLVDKVKADQIPVVFYIESSNHKVADTIASATGAKALLLHSAHNVTQAEIDAGATYLSIMIENMPKLHEALN
jgi:zinc transport system substrate-binding protein